LAIAGSESAVGQQLGAGERVGESIDRRLHRFGGCIRECVHVDVLVGLGDMRVGLGLRFGIRR
jgi:hypothetical protein